MTATISVGKTGARVVPYEALTRLPDPPSLGIRHKPIRHDALVQAIQAEAEGRGLHMKGANYAITPQGEKFFGTFTFDHGDDEKAWSLGVRNSVDKTISIRGVAGVRVFVCDNMALSGDQFVFKHKNTINLDVIEMVKAGVDKYIPAAEALDQQVARLQSVPLAEDRAKKLIYDAFVEHDVATIRLLPVVGEFFFDHGELGDNSFPDVTANLWGLHNAFTRAFKILKPASLYTATLRLGEAFGI